MAKQRWTSTPTNDAPIMKKGDRYFLITRLSTDDERFVDVDLGDVRDLEELHDDIVRWLQHAGILVPKVAPE